MIYIPVILIIVAVFINTIIGIKEINKINNTFDYLKL